MVKADSKQRYDLILESVDGKKLLTYGDDATPAAATPASESQAVEEGESSSIGQKAEVTSIEGGIWWIKARQGHSMKVRK